MTTRVIQPVRQGALERPFLVSLAFLQGWRFLSSSLSFSSPCRIHRLPAPFPRESQISQLSLPREMHRSPSLLSWSDLLAIDRLHSDPYRINLLRFNRVALSNCSQNDLGEPEARLCGCLELPDHGPPSLSSWSDCMGALPTLFYHSFLIGQLQPFPCRHASNGLHLEDCEQRRVVIVRPRAE